MCRRIIFVLVYPCVFGEGGFSFIFRVNVRFFAKIDVAKKRFYVNYRSAEKSMD